jgi:hypothetical protein
LTRIYGDGQKVSLRTEVAGVMQSFSVSVTQNNILLRIVNEGDVYYGWFSEDNGTTWNFVEQFRVAFANPRIGLGARMGPTTTPLTADFDWIKLETITYITDWKDGFDLPTLDGRWEWVREDNSLWSLTANPGNMQIISSGELYTTVNDQKNVLLTSAPNGDYRITTRVQASPTENIHGAAIYVYQDDDNYIELTRIYSNGQNVELRIEIGGVIQSFPVSVTQNDILLRIVNEGDVYYGWFSEDNGTTWNFVEQFGVAFSNPRVGLGAKMGVTTTPLTADFDWIHLENYMEQIFLPLIIK